MPTVESITALHSDMIAWRREIHRHPELAFAEHRTASLVAAWLREFGVDEVVEGIGRTGVVGVLRCGAGAAVGLRADMDALPIQEMNECDFRSRHANVMHACGHDGHIAMLLGAARYLAESRSFRGTVVLIFQPAEEGQAGAKAMIDDGLFERFPVEAIYGLHNMPGMAAGTFAVSAGAIMAAADSFTILVRGHGGHAAAPHQTRDPVVAGAAAVMALQTIVSRNAPPSDTAVLSVTEFHGGEAFNVVPDTVQLGGTVRYFSRKSGDLVRQRMAAILDGIAAAYNVTMTLDYREGYPPTVNSAPEADLARRVAAGVAGIDCVMAQEPRMYSEDFAYFLRRKPGAYLFLGNGISTDGHGLHSPRYNFNEEILPIGASFLVRVAETALAR
ncbi:MAG: amidohydrolase [Alphaproteobacteria bacterium]|nr:amidohydrolase [Alphaproteobacteria bacterium]